MTSFSFSCLDYFLFRWSCIILTSVAAVSAACTPVIRLQDVLYSKHLPGRTFRSVADTSFVGCLRECGLRQDCQSVNFFRQMHFCQLNNDSNGVNLEINPRCLFYNMTNELRNHFLDDSGTCGGAQCATLQVCRHGNCEYEECPVTEPQLYLGNRFSVGSKLLRSCELGYQQVGRLSVAGSSLWQPQVYKISWQCQGNGTWLESQERCDVIDWQLVFRASAGNGIDVYQAWINGVGVTTNDVNCMDLTSHCTQHYRHPSVDSWSTLPITMVKYALFKAGREVAYIVFNGENSASLTDWFAGNRVVSSTWSTLRADSTFTMFDIAGYASVRNFYIQTSPLTGCDNDIGFTGIMAPGTHHTCSFDIQGPHPSILFAQGTTPVQFTSADFVQADFAAIFIAQ